jgi:cell division protein FtsL
MQKYEIEGKITDLHDKIVSRELELERLDHDKSLLE